MTFARRECLHLLAGVVALPIATRCATAQAYPTRPVRIVVGFPPGGPNDILAHIIGQWLSARLGQPFGIENLAGAGGNTATETVVRAPADGATLLLVGPANAISASLYPRLSFDILRDIVPVAGITREPLMMVVRPGLPVTSAADVVAYAKSKPGALTLASTGAGTAPHLTGELFRLTAGVELRVVQYAGGGNALKALIDGQADVMFEPMSAAITPVRDGKLKALAVTTAMRSPALPGLSTLAEVLPGFEASAVTGVGAPHGTPVAIVETLNAAINAAFTNPAMRASLTDTGGVPLPGSAADFGKVFAEEVAKWADVVRRSGVRAE